MTEHARETSRKRLGRGAARSDDRSTCVVVQVNLGATVVLERHRRCDRHGHRGHEGQRGADGEEDAHHVSCFPAAVVGKCGMKGSIMRARLLAARPDRRAGERGNAGRFTITRHQAQSISSAWATRARVRDRPSVYKDSVGAFLFGCVFPPGAIPYGDEPLVPPAPSDFLHRASKGREGRILGAHCCRIRYVSKTVSALLVWTRFGAIWRRRQSCTELAAIKSKLHSQREKIRI